MAELPPTFGVVGGDVALAAQPIAVGDQPLESHRPPRRQGLGADAHLGAEPITVAVGEAGGAVEKHAGAVHRPQETVGGGRIGGGDGVGVAGAVAAHMLQGGFEILHHFHVQDQIGILRVPGAGPGRLLHPQGAGGGIAPQLHPRCRKAGSATARKAGAMA